MNIDRLLDLVHCHGTPGDETEVRTWLTQHFESCGWQVETHGQYAITATRKTRDDCPALLITAHMDSPGFSVEKVLKDKTTCITLGTPRFPGKAAEVRLRGKSSISELTQLDDDKNSYELKALGKQQAGDRACYATAPQLVNNEYILSPFLDNRLGCFLLAELAAALPKKKLPVNVILGATASEEMCGFGAAVLAEAISPDLVICLDATYEDEDQDVLMGSGPCLTLSDASMLLGTDYRDRVLKQAEALGIPLQTEVYNHSGTDAKAFPAQGRDCPVLAILIPTKGNHSPVEQAAIADIEALHKLLASLCQSRNTINKLIGSPT